MTNKTYKDANTDLEWLAGPDVDTTWDEAKEWVESLNNSNVRDNNWKMPTKDELRMLCRNGSEYRYKGGREGFLLYSKFLSSNINKDKYGNVQLH